jgi:hypothetical protein
MPRLLPIAPCVCTWSHATAARGAPASVTGRMGTRPMVLRLRAPGPHAVPREEVGAQPGLVGGEDRPRPALEHGLG